MFFIHGGYWRNGGSFLLYGVDEVLPHITRMNALSFWKERLYINNINVTVQLILARYKLARRSDNL